MRIKKNIIGYLLAGMIMMLGITNVYAHSCMQYIINQSHKTWTFRFSPNDGGVYIWGKAAIIDCSAGSNKNGPCVIPPAGDKKAAKVHYTTGGWLGGSITGKVYITDANGETKSYSYSNSTDVCPYIAHTGGDTGSVAMNRPGNGGFTVEDDCWDMSKQCGSAKK